MKAVTRAIVTAQRDCLKGHLATLESWAALYFSLGRAAQASEAESPDVKIWLSQAADQEYALLGDCERVGKVLAILGGE